MKEKMFTLLPSKMLVGVVGSWGYFCMGAVRAWSSPGIPSLNRTLNFDMDPPDFTWICICKLIRVNIK